MESKGNNDWSDRESDSSEDEESREKARPPADETPERPPEPDLRLGTIYEREPGSLSFPRPIFQERAPGEPETALGISPANPEAPEAERSTPTAAEQARIHQEQMNAQEEVADEEDDEEGDDEGEGKEGPEEDTEEPVEAQAPDEEASAEPTSPLPPFRGQATVPPPPPQRAEQVSTEPSQHHPAEEPLRPAAEPSRFAAPAESTAPAAASNQEQATPDQWRQQPAGQPPGPVPPPPLERPMPPAGSAGYPEPEAGRWQQHADVAPLPNLQGYNESQAYAAQPTTERQYSPAEKQRQKSVAPWVLTAALAGYLFGRRKVKPLEKQAATQQEEIDQLREKIAQFERQPMTPTQAIEQQARMPAGVPEGVYTPPQPSEAYPSMPVLQAEAPARQPEFSQGRTPPQQLRPETQPPTAAAPEQQPQVVIGEDGRQIVLQPGQRLVRGEGGYAEIVDEHNRVVQNAIQHGESYYQDQAPERQPTPFGSKDARFRAGGTAPLAGGGAYGDVPASPQLGTGQAPADHTLPANSVGQTPAEEAQHLLNAPKPNPVINAVTSPWLWLAVGVLMIAFFAAATI